MDRKKLRGNLMLTLTALIWGASFVAQSVGNELVGPFTFNAVRTLLGALTLLPVIALLDRLRGPQPARTVAEKRRAGKVLWLGGLCCGAALFAASTMQQVGISFTTAGKAGFITALYIVLVPILGIFLGKRAPRIVWLCVAVAVAGLFLLCVKENFSIGKGDLLVLCCALLFAVHILIIDHFSPLVDGVRMSCIQFLVAGLLGVPLMFWFETPTFSGILAAWVPICYSGILSCGVAYTLQIVAQKDTDPTIASLLLSLESVFAALSGWALLHETLTLRELLGCALVFAAIILAQLPPKTKEIQK